ncbi:MAG: DUF2652 domain-containing protein [Saprospiraceae bacterium]|nr:DUF2652 domain-containing protein [Saprospiraceae bacterium]
MAASLLFLPDISGFTKFIQSTEAAHSQHVIAELLEVLIEANEIGLQLAEIEGDALFFYIEDRIPSKQELLSQIERMFTAFYSHLKMLEKNRICPCNACSTAPQLELKIIAHSGDLQFITVQGNRKPFGEEVIQAHRLMKNSVDVDNYALISGVLANEIKMTTGTEGNLFSFQESIDSYDGKNVSYLYSPIDPNTLSLKTFETPSKVDFDRKPDLFVEKEFPIAGEELLEWITNYGNRHLWIDGVDKFEYNENEVTRLGTEHVCVIGGRQLEFKTVTKEGKQGQLVYGELTTSPPPVDKAYNFFIITPIDEKSSHLRMEVFFEAKSLIKRLALFLFVKKLFRKNSVKTIEGLYTFVSSRV